MNVELKPGEVIRCDSGKELKIISKLGEGGQGYVYKVNCQGREYALKWYKPSKMTLKKEFIKNLSRLVDKGSPNECFAWPLETTELYHGSYGYVMKLIPNEYREFSEFLNNLVKFDNLEARITAGLQIINSFRTLHNNGYSYQDMNDGNFFINPNTGDILICDNENIAPYGEAFGIKGKSRYMAPEIVTDKKVPDIHTDRFSMSVILFLLLFVDHPLEGAYTRCPCMHEELERKLFGTEPIFCMDPVDKRNRPVKGIHKNILLLWDMFPSYVHEIFERAFSKDALTGAGTTHRPIEQEWKNIFLKLRNELIHCTCGEDYFNEAGQIMMCPDCGHPHNTDLYLESSSQKITISNKHLLYVSDYNKDVNSMSKVTGMIISNPNMPNVYGLKKLSSENWTLIKPDNSKVTVPDGGVIGLQKGSKIEIDNNILEVK